MYITKFIYFDIFFFLQVMDFYHHSYNRGNKNFSNTGSFPFLPRLY